MEAAEDTERLWEGRLRVLRILCGGEFRNALAV